MPKQRKCILLTGANRQTNVSVFLQVNHLQETLWRSLVNLNYDLNPMISISNIGNNMQDNLHRITSQGGTKDIYLALYHQECLIHQVHLA
jgi:hypothetical protein